MSAHPALQLIQLIGLNWKVEERKYKEGMYVLPGFIDMHGHIGGKNKEPMRSMYSNSGCPMVSPRYAIPAQVMDLIGYWTKRINLPKIWSQHPEYFAYTAFGMGLMNPSLQESRPAPG